MMMMMPARCSFCFLDFSLIIIVGFSAFHVDPTAFWPDHRFADNIYIYIYIYIHSIILNLNMNI
jgi:hypothetical protein